jgi:nucleoid-associated protein YgaU
MKEGKPNKAGEKDPAEKEKARVYTVQRGDHLSDIAKKTLGTTKRALEIYQLNKDVMADEDSLTVGAVLKLPAR